MLGSVGIDKGLGDDASPSWRLHGWRLELPKQLRTCCYMARVLIVMLKGESGGGTFMAKP
jgi:hypothetical protein